MHIEVLGYGQEQGLLESVMERIREILKESGKVTPDKTTITADSGYNKRGVLASLEGGDIDAYVAYTGFRSSDIHIEGLRVPQQRN